MSATERGYTAGPVEFRALPEGSKNVGVLSGYAAVFDSMSEDLGGFREVIRPGAFDRALKDGQEVLARFEHSSSMLLGNSANGTLRLSIDERGLKYEIDVPNTGPGRDAVVLVERGDVSRSSFAFRVSREGQRWSQNEGAELREITDVAQLVDVAPVAAPAYRDTAVALRDLEDARAQTPAVDEAAIQMNRNRLRLRNQEV